MDTAVGGAVLADYAKDIPTAEDETAIESESNHLAEEEETMAPPSLLLTFPGQDTEENEDCKNSGSVGAIAINDALQSSGEEGASSGCCLWSELPRRHRQRLLQENQRKVTSISRLARNVSGK